MRRGSCSTNDNLAPSVTQCRVCILSGFQQFHWLLESNTQHLEVYQITCLLALVSGLRSKNHHFPCLLFSCPKDPELKRLTFWHLYKKWTKMGKPKGWLWTNEDTPSEPNGTLRVHQMFLPLSPARSVTASCPEQGAPPQNPPRAASG